MATGNDVSGVLLAGGRSTRFGTDDKLSARLRGSPLVHHAVLRLAEVTDDLVVVLAAGSPEPSLPAGVRVRIAYDAAEGQGPLEGAVAGLATVDRELSVVVGGDMPGLVPAVVREMLRTARDRGVDAVALAEGDRFRPLPVVVRTAAARAVGRALRSGGERALRRWLEALRVVVVDEAIWSGLDPERSTLRDVDERRDLEAAP